MIKKWRDLNMDWKKNMLIFMQVMGDNHDDWCAEQWENYGIEKEDAQMILDEYEKMFSEE